MMSRDVAEMFLVRLRVELFTAIQRMDTDHVVALIELLTQVIECSGQPVKVVPRDDT